MQCTRPRPLKKRARAAASITLLISASIAAQSPSGLQERVVFHEYSPLASEVTVVRRLLSPLAAGQIERSLQESRQQLREQSIDLAAEGFTVYVPRVAPAHGYALLVFVPPWPEARLPSGWAAVLDRYGVIFVSARNSGNEANDLGRRAPLALLAAYNLMSRYPVDAERVYVGGFSGGARVALRLALAYPDLFHGALLNAGSDPLDAGPPTPPSPQLLQQFQESSRLVYVTGERDTVHLNMDADSLRSLHQWCVFDAEAEDTLAAAHAVADANAFGRALNALLHPAPPAVGKLTACRAAIAQRVAEQLKEVAALIASDQRADAQKLLLAIDRHFGGVAAPQSLELQSQLGWQLPAH